jgi:phosphohistidine phosphatase
VVFVRLYLVQHAEAKREEEDPARPLSEKGWEDVKRITKFFRGKGIEVFKILHSGKLRARQTAEALAEGILPKEGVEEAEGLSPLDDPNIWREKLEGESKDIMLVGHLPHLSRLVGLLLTDDQNRKLVDFKMGGVVCVERDENGKWSIQWMLIPQIL